MCHQKWDEGSPGTRGTSQHKLLLSMCFIGPHQSRIDKGILKKKKNAPQNGLTEPDQVINRLECCGGQVSAGVRENRGVLALLESDSFHWNISGRRTTQELGAQTCKERGPVSAPNFAVQIYADITSIRKSYLFLFNSDESPCVVIAL